MKLSSTCSKWILLIENAAHIVDKFEKDRDRKYVYDDLFKRYEGEELNSETAEDIRAKIDKTSIYTLFTASEYINAFLDNTKYLDEIHESYTIAKAVNIFLDQITDSDYSKHS